MFTTTTRRTIPEMGRGLIPSLLVAVLLALPVPTRGAPFPGTLTWDVRADIPGGVEGAAGGLIGSQLYVSHGFRFGDSAALSIYDIPSNSWTSGPAAAVIRSEMAGGAAAGKFYAIGGRTGPNADVEAFDPVVGTWSTVASLSAPRGGLGAASIGGLIYAVGGRTGRTFGSGTILGTNEVYTPGTNTWATLASMPTPLSDVYATVGFGGKVYVLGGASAPATVTGLVQIYDPATDSWSTGAPMPTPRAAAMAGALCNQIIVFGGVAPALGNLSATEIYDPADDTWSTGPSMPIPVSEVAQGPTQTADTIFSVGSGIFGVTGTTVKRWWQAIARRRRRSPRGRSPALGACVHWACASPATSRSPRGFDVPTGSMSSRSCAAVLIV